MLATLIIRSKNQPLSLFGDDHYAFHMPFYGRMYEVATTGVKR